MFHLVGESFKASGERAIQQLLGVCLCWHQGQNVQNPARMGEGQGAVHQMSGEPSTHILESVDAGILGPLGREGERRRPVSIYWAFAAHGPFFHLTWPRVLEHCGNTTCNVWLQSQVFVLPLVRLRGCQGSLQARWKTFFTWNKTPGLV